MSQGQLFESGEESTTSPGRCQPGRCQPGSSRGSSFPPGWPEDSDWSQPLRDAFADEGFPKLMNFVSAEREQSVVFPPAADVFNAFRFCALADTRVVILGQDPYHGMGQAHGLSFSVLDGVKVPPSLRNIYREMAEDVGCEIPASGNLESWARQGVLLLNTVLTVRESEAHSHRKKGWEQFTDSVIGLLGQRELPCVFVFWGKPAQKKAVHVQSHHAVIASPHPSPLSASRGFFGSRPFSRANEALESFGHKPIVWSIQ